MCRKAKPAIIKKNCRREHYEEMRRKDREVTELEAVKEIIRQCDVLRLGLVDGDYPYIVPMNFGWEEKEGRLHNGQGDCYPADRGRKAPGHAAFD